MNDHKMKTNSQMNDHKLKQSSQINDNKMKITSQMKDLIQAAEQKIDDVLEKQERQHQELLNQEQRITEQLNKMVNNNRQELLNQELNINEQLNEMQKNQRQELLNQVMNINEQFDKMQKSHQSSMDSLMVQRTYDTPSIKTDASDDTGSKNKDLKHIQNKARQTPKSLQQTNLEDCTLNVSDNDLHIEAIVPLEIEDCPEEPQEPKQTFKQPMILKSKPKQNFEPSENSEQLADGNKDKQAIDIHDDA